MLTPEEQSSFERWRHLLPMQQCRIDKMLRDANAASTAVMKMQAYAAQISKLVTPAVEQEIARQIESIKRKKGE
jgi:hypothetical protein